MVDYYLGEIRAFPFGRVPRGWMPCDGRLLNIKDYNALFSLLSNMYGGDGRNNFALPDLRGRTVIGKGQGAGLTKRDQGKAGGTELVTLQANNIPPHMHNLSANATAELRCRNADPDNISPASNTFARSPKGETIKRFSSNIPDTQMKDSSIKFSGNIGSTKGPHENMQPFMAMNYCITITGVYPSRP
jgi:microcystin-dependent protein